MFFIIDEINLNVGKIQNSCSHSATGDSYCPFFSCIIQELILYLYHIYIPYKVEEKETDRDKTFSFSFVRTYIILYYTTKLSLMMCQDIRGISHNVNFYIGFTCLRMSHTIIQDYKVFRAV